MSTSSENSKSVPVSRREQRSSAQAFIDNLKGMAHPNSRRIFIQGSRSDIRVGLREIVLADTFVGGSKEDPQFEPNDPVPVYDTSGAYGDESAEIDVRRGLPRLREAWVLERGDTEALDDLSSAFTQERLADEGLDHLRFDNLPKPLRARPGRRVTQLHYARQGVVTPEMEFIAIRENMVARGCAPSCCCASIRARVSVPACHRTSPPNSCAMRWPPAAPSSPATSTTRKPSP